MERALIGLGYTGTMRLHHYVTYLYFWKHFTSMKQKFLDASPRTLTDPNKLIISNALRLKSSHKDRLQG